MVLGSVRTIFDDYYISGTDQETQDAFAEWRLERNRRVAHSVGFREEHRVVVFADSESDAITVTSASHSALRPNGEGVRWVRSVLAGLWTELKSHEEKLLAAIAKEVAGLPLRRIEKLAPYRATPLGQGRSPGT